ncbi:hypothetical protein M1D49_00380 [Bacillus sp. PK3-056]|uniref:hypothetical protein n=1 Tax=Niallia circulans TaxID=1397 RepID=UPI000F44D4A1|nr:hypothetical protein [Niallia circulans]AYV72919.1 hypothetical protein C2H98_15990 [Niallia circulans]
MSNLTIKKLILLGTKYKRTIEFYEGLNIIRGERTSGKSLVLSLIDYCFGKSEKIELNVQKQLDEYCDRVFIEVKIGDEILTIYRLLKEKTDKLGFYFCEFSHLNEYIPKIVDKKEAMQLIMRKLNISEYKRAKYKPHSTEQELETISFRDIFRYVYIKQHALGTDNFLDNKSTFKANKNPFAFEMIFNLIEQDKNQLKDKLVNENNSIDALNKQITGLHSYLKDKEAEDFNELYSISESINEKISEKQKEKELVIKESNAKNSNENIMYIKLKKRLSEIINHIESLNKQKSDLYKSLSAKELLIQDYKQERLETAATVEVNYRLHVKEQNIECPLCHSTVKSNIHKEEHKSDKILEKIQKELQSKINLVKNTIERDLEKIEGLDIEINRLEKEQLILENAIAEYSKDTSVPYLSQIDSINSVINSYSKDKEIIDECMRVHRKIDEKRTSIAEHEKEIKRIQAELKKLKVTEDKKNKIFDVLNEKYKSYMLRLKYSVNTDTYIDSEKYIPYHDGASVFEHESGGLLECMQISFLSAILSSKEKGYAQGHPGLLMLDSISKYLGTIKTDTNEEINDIERINDPEVYEEIYKILIELSVNNQIIVVDNTPPDIVTSYSKYTFYSGKKGLVDLSVNELDDIQQ